MHSPLPSVSGSDGSRSRSMVLLAQAGGRTRSHVHGRYALDDCAHRHGTDGVYRQRAGYYQHQPHDEVLSGSHLLDCLRRLQRQAGADVGRTDSRTWYSVPTGCGAAGQSATVLYRGAADETAPQAGTRTNPRRSVRAPIRFKFIAAFKTLQAPVARESNVAGISLTKYAATHMQIWRRPSRPAARPGFCQRLQSATQPAGGLHKSENGRIRSPTQRKELLHVLKEMGRRRERLARSRGVRYPNAGRKLSWIIPIGAVCIQSARF